MHALKRIPSRLALRIFDALSESTDDLVYVVDREGRYAKFNARGLNACGLRSEDVLGKTPSEAFDAKLAFVLESNNQKAFTTGRPLVLQEWMEIDGKQRCYATTLTPVMGTEGLIDCLVGFSRDVTDQKRLAEEVSIYEQQVQTFFAEPAHVGSILRDITRLAVTATSVDDFLDAVVRMLGERGDVCRVYFFKYDSIRQKASNSHEWCAPGVSSWTEHMQDIPASEQPWWSEEMLSGRSIILPDAADVPSPELKELLRLQEVRALMAIPIFAFGQVYGFIGFDDCTRPRQWDEMEVDLLSAVGRMISQKVERHQLEENTISAERLAATGRLVAAITHEINNPLQGVVLHLETLEELIPPEGTRSLKRVKEGIAEIIGIVSRLLEVHRDEKQLSEIDVNKSLADAYALVSHTVDMKGVNVKWDLSPMATRFKGDGRKLRQVFLNLFLNALDSMDRGGYLDISTVDDACHISVRIRDTGCGIEEEALPFIFDPFYTTKGRKGTGLGLYVSHAIVVEHGGRIEVESKPTQGTDIRLYLPKSKNCTHIHTDRSQRPCSPS
jgi:PAS domain S-box-containing protein